MPLGLEVNAFLFVVTDFYCVYVCSSQALNQNFLLAKIQERPKDPTVLFSKTFSFDQRVPPYFSKCFKLRNSVLRAQRAYFGVFRQYETSGSNFEKLGL